MRGSKRKETTNGNRSLLEKRIAKIILRKNNGALSCTCAFLSNAFLSHQLSPLSEEKLTKLFNSYYHNSLSTEQLYDIFANVITLPQDQENILIPLLKSTFPENETTKKKKSDLRSNQLFQPLAQLFGINIAFYATVEGKIGKTGALNVPDATTTMRPYFNGKTYDLIMDDKATAASYNAATATSQFTLPTTPDEEKIFVTKVNEMVLNRYDPKQKEEIDSFIKTLREKYNDLGMSQLEAAIILSFTDKIKELSNYYFQQSIPKRAEILDQVKKQAEEEFNYAAEKLSDLPTPIKWPWNSNELSVQEIMKNILKIFSTPVATTKDEQPATPTTTSV